MRNLICTLVLATVAAASGNASADPERKRYCSESLVRGTYAIHLSGKQTLPDGSVQEIIGVVIRLYDGDGHVIQWDSIKNSVTGYTPNRYGQGTYRVNDDCTVDIEFNPAPTVTIRERSVIVDEGREMRAITVFPAGLFVTSIQQRI
jgi:hypothetical protein